MKGIRLGALLGAMWAAGAGLSEAQAPAKPSSGWDSQKPAGNHDTRTLVSGGTKLGYYVLSADDVLALTAKGPATLMIASVQVFPAGTAAESEYTYFVDADKKPAKQTAKSGPDKVVKFSTPPADNSSPGEKKSVKIEIPAGDHTYAFRPDPACAKTVLVRIYVRPKFPDANRSTLIEAGGKKSRYYAMTGNDSVRLVVTGPTQLKLSTKLDFPKDAKPTDSYNVFVSVDGGRATRDSFNAARSKSAKYVTPPQAGSQPGALRSKVYDVPAGKHVFVFSLDKGVKQTVWTRLSLKKK